MCLLRPDSRRHGRWGLPAESCTGKESAGVRERSKRACRCESEGSEDVRTRFFTKESPPKLSASAPIIARKRHDGESIFRLSCCVVDWLRDADFDLLPQHLSVLHFVLETGQDMPLGIACPTCEA
jgi:hypothetical protein